MGDYDHMFFLNHAFVAITHFDSDRRVAWALLATAYFLKMIIGWALSTEVVKP